jgi:hypothetical protein
MGPEVGISLARLGRGERCLALLSASGPFVEQPRALMDASGFAYQHSRLRLRQAPARPTNRGPSRPRSSCGCSPKPSNRDRPPLFRELHALNPQQHVARS